MGIARAARLAPTVGMTMLAACATLPAADFVPARFALDGIRAATVKGYDGTLEAEECAGFVLDERQIRLYFSRAQPAPEAIAVERFRWLPCYVEGGMTAGEQHWRWAIFATGFARLDDGEISRVLYCGQACSSVFDNRTQPPRLERAQG